MREVERCPCRKHAVVLAVRDQNGTPDQGEVHRCLISPAKNHLELGSDPLGEVPATACQGGTPGTHPSRGPPAVSLSSSAPRAFALRSYDYRPGGRAGQRAG